MYHHDTPGSSVLPALWALVNLVNRHLKLTIIISKSGILLVKRCYTKLAQLWAPVVTELWEAEAEGSQVQVQCGQLSAKSLALIPNTVNKLKNKFKIKEDRKKYIISYKISYKILEQAELICGFNQKSTFL